MRDEVFTGMCVQFTVHYALFANLWNAPISSVTPVRPFSRMYQLDSHWKDLQGIWYESILLKSFEKVNLW